MLGKVAHGEVFATHQPTALRLKLAGEVFDQRRLACAVRTQQTDACARRELQFDLLEDGLVAITQTRVGQVQQRAGYLVGLTEDEVER